MKRTLCITALLLLALTALAVSSCAAPIRGAYNVYSINGRYARDYFEEQAASASVDLETLLTMFAAPGFSGDPDDYMVLDFGDGGSCSVSVFGEERSGVFTKKDKDITISLSNGEVLHLRYVTSQALIEYDQDENTRILFQKVPAK